MVYTFKAVSGSRLSDEQAQKYGVRLSAIEEQNAGVITPEMVVKDAESAESPLHDAFEWDDAKAANEWRKEQASYLLRSINIVVTHEKRTDEVRAFHSISVENVRNYTSLARVMESDELRKQIIEQALKELEAWRKKYRIYDELSKYFSALDAVEVVK